MLFLYVYVRICYTACALLTRWVRMENGFLSGGHGKKYLKVTNWTKPNTKRESNLEVCFVFIPDCPVRSARRRSRHLGIRPKFKCSLIPLSWDLGQSLTFPDPWVPEVQGEMISTSECWWSKDLVWSTHPFWDLPLLLTVERLASQGRTCSCPGEFSQREDTEAERA